MTARIRAGPEFDPLFQQRDSKSVDFRRRAEAAHLAGCACSRLLLVGYVFRFGLNAISTLPGGSPKRA
jgi:hypothetical protein